MKNTAIEKLSYTEVTKNISQAEYNQTQEEYILSKSPDKYMISLPVKVLMFEGAKDSSPFTYYFYMENDEDLYLMQRKRNGSVVDKTKIPLTKEQGQKILDGDYQFLLDSDEPLLNSLYFQFTVNQLHPLYRKECTRKIFHQNRFLDEIVDIHIVRTPFEEDQDFFATHDTMLKGGTKNNLRRNTRQYLNMSKPMEDLLNYQNSLMYYLTYTVKGFLTVLAAKNPFYITYRFLPQHFLYFFPEPQGQGSFLPILGSVFTYGSLFFSSCNIKFSSSSSVQSSSKSIILLY